MTSGQGTTVKGEPHLAQPATANNLPVFQINIIMLARLAQQMGLGCRQ